MTLGFLKSEFESSRALLAFLPKGLMLLYDWRFRKSPILIQILNTWSNQIWVRKNPESIEIFSKYPMFRCRGFRDRFFLFVAEPKHSDSRSNILPKMSFNPPAEFFFLPPPESMPQTKKFSTASKIFRLNLEIRIGWCENQSIFWAQNNSDCRSHRDLSLHR